MAEYWRILESVSGWREYNIPKDVCEDEDSAMSLVDACIADDYLMDSETDFSSIASIELISEERS